MRRLKPRCNNGSIIVESHLVVFFVEDKARVFVI